MLPPGRRMTSSVVDLCQEWRGGSHRTLMLPCINERRSGVDRHSITLKRVVHGADRSDDVTITSTSDASDDLHRLRNTGSDRGLIGE